MRRIESLVRFMSGVNRMRRPVEFSALFLIVAVVFYMAAVTPAASAAEFSEAELFVELNNTDEDLGLHLSIDGGPYRMLEIEDPNERRILLLTALGRLAKQGLTQLFIESAEPSFDELSPEMFFSRFPEGTYEISARDLTGKEFETEAELSHVLAAPVDHVTINGEATAENCDSMPLPSVSEPITIDWDPVTTSHPEVGESGPVVIARYQFFVEQGDLKIGVDLPPTQTQFMVPSEIIALGDTSLPFKFEIIARTDTGNSTAIENCFLVE